VKVSTDFDKILHLLQYSQILKTFNRAEYCHTETIFLAVTQ